MIHKDSSRHVICSQCSAEADPEYKGALPLCKLHADTWLFKQASRPDSRPERSLRELANTGDAHNADE